MKSRKRQVSSIGADKAVFISGCFWNCRYDIYSICYFGMCFDTYCDIVQVTVCAIAGKLFKCIVSHMYIVSQKRPFLQGATAFPTV